MESSIKSLIGRLRAKPDWESADPAVRALAVLRLSSEERDLLASLAEDPDPHVRKAAAKKIHEPLLLTRLATADADSSVRDEAAEALLAMALHARDEAQGQLALGGLLQPKHLVAIVRAAADAATRRAALEKLTDAKSLAAAARDALDPELRLLAIARLTDPGQLLSLAQNSDHKPVALAALEKIDDEAALRAVAARARSSAAARRAKARLEENASHPTQTPLPRAPLAPEDEADREAYERKLATLREEQDARTRALQGREAVCDRLEAATAETAQEAMDEARAAWEGLSPLPGPEAAPLQQRFDAALEACHRRVEVSKARQAVVATLEPILAEAEALAEAPDLAAARDALFGVRQRWQEAGDKTPGLDDLRARFEAAAARLAEREVLAGKDREAQAKSTLERLLALARRLTTLAAAPGLTLRDADRALREAKEALEDPAPLPTRRDREMIHGRLEAVRKALHPRLAELRVDTEWKRWANETVQEDLVSRAQALGTETNLEKAAQEIRDLDIRWKAAAEVDKQKGEALWKTFKAARDEVKAKVDEYFEQRAAELAENLKKKQELCTQAEALQDSTVWLKTADELKRLQEEWKKVGPTAHGPGKTAWERFRKACDHFFTRRESDLKLRKDDWAANEASKQTLCERAEALALSSDWDAAAAEIKKLQAEWKTVGPVKKSRSEVLWQRFRAACDQFFERHKRRDEIGREKMEAEREALVSSLEALVPAPDALAPEGLGASVSEIQRAWRQAGPPPREQAETGERFRNALVALIAAFPEVFKGTDLDPAAARKRLEKLCAKVEALAPAADAPAKSLAEQLKDALATNTMGGKGEAEARKRAVADEVRAAREALSRLSPLPGPEGDALKERFEAAARRAIG